LTEQILKNLHEKGWVRLKNFEISPDIQKKLLLENKLDSKVYKENSKLNLSYLNQTNLGEYLKDLLKEYITKEHFHEINPDIYNVCRMVSSSDSKESYRAHFDSHMFTVVSPMQIPYYEDEAFKKGELILFPNIRNEPKNEYINFLQKLFFKIFANKIGFYFLKFFFDFEVFDFKDNIPILFLGRRSLHFNMPFKNTGIPRITLLTHVYDPSGKSGIGSFLRKVRNR